MPPTLPISAFAPGQRGRLLHILATSPLPDGEVLVHFADGSSAIYEMEELEKLRPTPKKLVPVAAQNPPFSEVA